jgi:hypothetical protein
VTIDRGMERRQPIVARRLRRIISTLPPEADGSSVVARLEQRYLVRAGASGAATGAVAALPGVGTVAALALSAADTAAFFTATAFFVQARVTLDDSVAGDPEHVRALMLALLLGHDASAALRQLAGEAAEDGPSREDFRKALAARGFRSSALWLPTLGRVQRESVGRKSALSRALPFGAGAVLGAAGGWSLARRIVAATQALLDPAPAIPERLRALPVDHR